MIDIHNHILPGIDDGSPNLETSLEMARQAQADGIETIIVTPHHNNGKFSTPADVVQKATKSLQEACGKAGLTIQILPGQEVRVTSQLLEEFEENRIQTLANSRYVLVELPSADVPKYFEDMMYEIGVLGYEPILAHPERNATIIREPKKLLEWVENGLLTQVTAHSVIGLFGSQIQKFSIELVGNNLTHFIASDAHDLRKRTLQIQQAHALIASKFGNEKALRLQENARAVVHNRSIEVERPQWKPRKRFWLF